MIDFYRCHRISPVRQDISSLKAHFQRRASLYRQLGVLPGFLRGRSVLEVGPGSGYNALYTAHLEPGRYLLLEPNPTAVEHIEELFSGYPGLRPRFQIESSLLGEFETGERFDFVFCEGMLVGMTDPERHMRLLAGLTRPGGILVVTCSDAVSLFPETVRRLLAQLVIDPAAGLEEQTAALAPIFGLHAATLRHMTRRAEDWIVDNLICPVLANNLFSMAEAITAVADTCTAYGSSPQFFTDWRWYKSLFGEAREFNRRALEQYEQSLHNLLDYRRVLPPRPAADNRVLAELCRRGWRQMSDFESDRDRARLGPIAATVREVAAAAAPFGPEASEALLEAAGYIEARQPDWKALAHSTGFGALFGRGQQYLSLARNAEEE